MPLTPCTRYLLSHLRRRCAGILLCGGRSLVSILSLVLYLASASLSIPRGSWIFPLVSFYSRAVCFHADFASCEDFAGPITPKKTSSLFVSVQSPRVSGSGSRDPVKGNSYASVRKFEDAGTPSFTRNTLLCFHIICSVPIYDGRPSGSRSGFSFSDKEFHALTALPLYKKGMRDLPENAVVAVGYSLNTYKLGSMHSPHLSTNVQFVILLGVAAAAL